jgi:deoxyribonuclease V
MKIDDLHPWDYSPKEAVALQRQLAGGIDIANPLHTFRTVAGADISYNRYSPILYACVVVLKLPELKVVEQQAVVVRTAFPYVPGLLSFREAPALLAAFRKLRRRPDLVMIDGHGYAHPRRIGIASHIGLWLDLPTIGCAKTRLTGTFRPPGPRAGASTALLDRGTVIGRVLRNKSEVAPIFVSVGHHIDLESALKAVRITTRRHRLPEPTRLAHLAVNEYRRHSGHSGGHE